MKKSILIIEVSLPIPISPASIDLYSSLSPNSLFKRLNFASKTLQVLCFFQISLRQNSSSNQLALTACVLARDETMAGDETPLAPRTVLALALALVRAQSQADSGILPPGRC